MLCALGPKLRLRFDFDSTALRPFDDLRYDRRPTCCGLLHYDLNKLYAGGRHDMPRPSPPPWAPKRLAASRRQRSSGFPRPTRSHAHHCSRLTRQDSGEQGGLVTLTFDLLTLKVVSESRVTWATSANFGLPRPLCSRLRPDVRDRHRRQTRIIA